MYVPYSGILIVKVAQWRVGHIEVSMVNFEARGPRNLYLLRLAEKLYFFRILSISVFSDVPEVVSIKVSSC